MEYFNTINDERNQHKYIAQLKCTNRHSNDYITFRLRIMMYEYLRILKLEHNVSLVLEC